MDLQKKRKQGESRGRGSLPSSASPSIRLEHLRSSISALNADGILVSSPSNIRYLCEFTGSAGLLLVERESALLLTDSRYTFQAAEEVKNARVEISKEGLFTRTGKLISRKRSLRRLAYSQAHVTVGQKLALEKSSGRRVRWIDDANSVETLRMIKDESELAVMREAAELISLVFKDTLRYIKVGVTEIDLASEIEQAMKRRGASGPSFETIVASGERSAWPHARPTATPIGKNGLVVLDDGAILRGYCSDMTRTVFLGSASKRVKQLYNAVLEAQQAAKNAIRPGVSAGEVDRAARKVLTKAGLGRYFMHSTGHGLGLEVHEMPRIGKGSPTALQKGMVITIEPGVYLQGLGGVRIEDDVLVTSNGYRDLTTAPREFLEL